MYCASHGYIHNDSNDITNVAGDSDTAPHSNTCPDNAGSDIHSGAADTADTHSTAADTAAARGTFSDESAATAGDSDATSLAGRE